jgi:hypothetical protein
MHGNQQNQFLPDADRLPARFATFGSFSRRSEPCVCTDWHIQHRTSCRNPRVGAAVRYTALVGTGFRLAAGSLKPNAALSRSDAHFSLHAMAEVGLGAQNLVVEILSPSNIFSIPFRPTK